MLHRLGVVRKFGVREFLLRYPDLKELVFTPRLRKLLAELFRGSPSTIKSIYFDKPPAANWVVSWHQDLTVNLQSRGTANGFINWRTTKERTVVQPATQFLERIVTLRIHLDECTEANGALRVIPGSHLRGVIDIKSWKQEKDTPEKIGEVPAGGVLVMKPLLLHSSRRTTTDAARRVIHLEFTDQALPVGLVWKEAIAY